MNLFDGLIVILSEIDIFLIDVLTESNSKSSAFSAFRTIRIIRIFRVLRVTRLIRYILLYKLFFYYKNNNII